MLDAITQYQPLNPLSAFIVPGIMFGVNYKHLSDVTDIERIARGSSVQIKRWLNETFGLGKWRKLKGRCTVEYENGEIWLVELHWFEAHGIGKRLEKDKYKLRRLK